MKMFGKWGLLLHLLLGLLFLARHGLQGCLFFCLSFGFAFRSITHNGVILVIGKNIPKRILQ
jgi:hypothetical protein